MMEALAILIICREGFMQTQKTIKIQLCKINVNDTYRTTYYGLYFAFDKYLRMMTALDLRKDFTFDFFLRIDEAPVNDYYYLLTKVKSILI
jgi:hypothetical protein